VNVLRRYQIDLREAKAETSAVCERIPAAVGATLRTGQSLNGRPLQDWLGVRDDFRTWFVQNAA
jgi:hypothetical protein